MTTLRWSGAAGCLLAIAFASSMAAAQTGAQTGAAALPSAPGGQPIATADMIGADGKRMGTAAFVGTPNGVLIEVRMTGVAPGTHGLHIHQAGKCEAPDFKSAGGHFNPGGASHGFLAAKGSHGGDLPNVFAAANGEVQADIRVDAVSLGTGANSLFHEGGTALVMHAAADDYHTDPAGASGDRIACGVIARATKPAGQ